MLLGVDTGGTFTDFVLLPDIQGSEPIRTHKVLSTPESPDRAILQGIQEMGLGEAMRAGQVKIIHGSTVATNAVLEGKGARTVFVTNHGFADILALARQTRPRLYALEMPPSPAPVPPELCLETGGRVDAEGETVTPLESGDMQQLARQISRLAPEAVAINFLFSFLDERHETALADFLRNNLDPVPFISRSSQVLPEYKEYERGVATWLNASLGPLVQRYLNRLRRNTAPASVAVM